MAIWDWSGAWEAPFRELRRLRREMDRTFEDMGLGSWLAGRPSHQHPPVNVFNTEDQVVVVAELPGVSADDLEITLRGEVLSIGGERKEEVPEGVTYHRRERGVGRFSRLVQLPDAVDVGGIKAEYLDGLLTVRLPKAEEAKPKKITVTSK